MSAVASVLQESLSTKQLLDIAEWLSTRTEPAESLGRIHILAAISSGVSDTELVDMTNMKTFDGAFLEKYSKKEPSALSVSRWLIAENALSRGTQDEATQVWSRVKADVERILKKSTIAKEGTFAASDARLISSTATCGREPGVDARQSGFAIYCKDVPRDHAYRHW